MSIPRGESLTDVKYKCVLRDRLEYNHSSASLTHRPTESSRCVTESDESAAANTEFWWSAEASTDWELQMCLGIRRIGCIKHLVLIVCLADTSTHRELLQMCCGIKRVGCSKHWVLIVYLADEIDWLSAPDVWRSHTTRQQQILGTRRLLCKVIELSHFLLEKYNFSAKTMSFDHLLLEHTIKLDDSHAKSHQALPLSPGYTIESGDSSEKIPSSESCTYQNHVVLWRYMFVIQ